jgi:CysZ protein
MVDHGLTACQSNRVMKMFTLSVAQLGDPAILRVLAKSLLITLIVFAVAGTGLVWGVQYGAHAYGWGQDGSMVAGVVAAIGIIAAGWVLFRAVAVPVTGFFADDVVAAVEALHYPGQAARARTVSFGASLRLALLSVLRVVAANLIALPFYALLLLTAIGPVVLFVAINAILLGRDLGEMVAVRHLDPAACRVWLRATRGQRMILGLAVTGLFVVPIVNFIAPILGAAMATHMFHRGNNRL